MINRKTPNFAYGNFATQKDLICVKEEFQKWNSPNSNKLELSLTPILCSIPEFPRRSSVQSILLYAVLRLNHRRKKKMQFATNHIPVGELNSRRLCTGRKKSGSPSYLEPVRVAQTSGVAHPHIIKFKRNRLD